MVRQAAVCTKASDLLKDRYIIFFSFVFLFFFFFSRKPLLKKFCQPLQVHVKK